jgi:phage shock protein C
MKSNATSIEQLESMLRDGRISSEEYARLRDVMRGKPQADRSAARRLRKSWTDRQLGGVCGGLARYYGVSATRIRLAFLLLLLLTGGTAMAVYLALYIVLPWDESNPSRIPEFPWKFLAAVLVLGVGLIALIQVVVPGAIVEVTQNVGSELPAPVRALFVVSDWMDGAGIIAVPAGLLILIVVGVALRRQPRAYSLYTRVVIGGLIAVLTLQVLVLAAFLLVVA